LRAEVACDAEEFGWRLGDEARRDFVTVVVDYALEFGLKNAHFIDGKRHLVLSFDGPD